MELIQIMIDGLFEFRRGLLSQVAALDHQIEKLTTLKENTKQQDEIGLPDPNKCQHIFLKGICKHCAIFEEVAKKHNVGIIKEADQPDK